jgi:hypothetical protein
MLLVTANCDVVRFLLYLASPAPLAIKQRALPTLFRLLRDCGWRRFRSTPGRCACASLHGPQRMLSTPQHSSLDST